MSAQVACWQHKSADAENAEPPSCNMAARVEQNIMHDAVCYNYGADGFYTDENAEGVDLVSNLIYDVQSAGVYFHCGVNLTSTNNFVYNADSGGHRGALSGCNMGGFSKHLVLDANYQRNIVYVVGKASHFSTPNTQVDNSTFNQNLYYDPSKPLVFPNGADFQQWQASGRVRLNLQIWNTIVPSRIYLRKSAVKSPLEYSATPAFRTPVVRIPRLSELGWCTYNVAQRGCSY